MAASSVRAAVVSKEHHFVADFTGVEEDESGVRNRSRTGSRSSSGRRNSSPQRDDLAEAQQILSDLNPACTSTPIDGNGSGANGSTRRRNRSHSGNSVTFQGATPTRPDNLPVSHSSGIMASPGINRTNPDEIIILEGDSSLTSSQSSSNAQIAASFHHSYQRSDVQIQAPIVGYEIMEERARFTVFKIHVAKTEEDWFIFRRYTDFVRLNDKLKAIFPHFRLSLPPKKWFGDNFDRNFLEDRMLGLQAFLNNVTSHRDVADSEPVKEFFCYDDPPGAHDSLEESKALCETLEEKIYDLKRALKEKDARILLLEEEVSLHKAEVENLRKSLRLECTIYSNSVVYYRQLEPDHILSLVLLNLIERALNAKHKRSSPTSTSVTSIASQRSDSSIMQDQMSYTEADQAHMASKASSLTGGEVVEDGGTSGCDSVITSPSSSSVDILENLQDFKLHSVYKVENFDNDPNANCEIAPPVFEPVGNTVDLIANINYKKQDSVSTLVNEDLNKSGELEWDEDLTSGVEGNLDSAGFSEANGSALLPAT